MKLLLAPPLHTGAATRTAPTPLTALGSARSIIEAAIVLYEWEGSWMSSPQLDFLRSLVGLGAADFINLNVDIILNQRCSTTTTMLYELIAIVRGYQSH
jgi:hypothetical protein